MRFEFYNKFLYGFFLFSLLGCEVSTRAQFPDPPREFRGVWVASVWNIDWPSSPGLSVAQLKSEFFHLLDVAQESGANAIVLQIRPEGDAFYKSSIEPWSYWLTGQQGLAPEGGFDPLAFAVEEAHRRGMELHAWFNPFRARSTKVHPIHEKHVIRKHPEYIMEADRYLWMNPGIEAVRHYSLSVFEDVLRRYDIDGVHIDDYFYPYPKRQSDGSLVYTFDDSETYRAYQASGGTLSLLDWRRQNIDQFVQDLYSMVKRVKQHVKVGISPFGIYRPGIPPSIEASIDPYVHLATDTRRWLQEGWIDYFTPQLYWRIDQVPQSFRTLVQWWAQQNYLGRHLWPGIASSRILGSGSDAQRRAQESVDQILESRLHAGNAQGSGNIQWSARALLDNRDGLVEKLRQDVYQELALVPESPWLGSSFLSESKPRLLKTFKKNKMILEIQNASTAYRWWLIQVKKGAKSQWKTLPLQFSTNNVLEFSKDYSEILIRGVLKNASLSSWSLSVKK